MTDIADSAMPASLTGESVVTAVWDSLSPRIRKKIGRDDLESVVAEISFDEARPTCSAPALRIKRLVFSGIKTLNDQPPKPFKYDQTFAPGVNVICVEKNEGGKSSILKTIKFALTGDDGEYDVDVRPWIHNVWLTFQLGKREYTIIHSRRDEHRAVMVPGIEERSIEVVSEEVGSLFDRVGSTKVRESLKQFFFQQLDLEPLSWNQQDASVPGGVAERKISWLTYFQALYIPGGGDEYLICDTQHAMGNQDGLLLSAFLGLNLVEPLNILGVEVSRQSRAVKEEKRFTEEHTRHAKTYLDQLQSDRQIALGRLNDVKRAQTARQRAVLEREPIRRLSEIEGMIPTRLSEKSRLLTERDELSRNLQRLHSQTRTIREAIDFKLHFTGIEVILCPSCDSQVEEESIQREYNTHCCRLCGKQAHAADADEIDALNARVTAVDRSISELELGRKAIYDRLSAIKEELTGLNAEAERLRIVASQGYSYAAPSPEEDEELGSIYGTIGALDADISRTRARLEHTTEEIGQSERRRIAAEHIREYLKQIATDRNGETLATLAMLTQDAALKIGADSISDVECSALGKVKLSKHGVKTSFRGINNEGERLRIKLAFFLAMMQLGRQPGLGRHPGFLMIDQPGSAEMVKKDVEALAQIFRKIDEDMAYEVQVICCTARKDFEAATAAEKVYGPQDPPDAF